MVGLFASNSGYLPTCSLGSRKTVTLADPYRDYQIDYSPHEQSKAQEQQGQLVYEADHQQQSAALHHGGRPEAAFMSSGHTSQFQSQHHQQHHPHSHSHSHQHQHPHQHQHQHPHHQSPHQHHHPTPTQQPQQPQPPPHAQPGSVLMPSPSQHNVVRELQQPVMISPLIPPPISTHFSSAPLPSPYSIERQGVKRRRIDGGPGSAGGETTSGILSILTESSHTDEPHSADMLISASGDHSAHHQPPPHDYHQTSPIHQQHHHHRLPSQAALAAVQGGDGELTSPGGAAGSQSVVGQPGMPDPAPRPRGPKLKFTPEDDRLLVELKENRNLTWKQIAEFFPGRTSGTLQVRYCTKLRAKATVWTDEAVLRLRNAIQDYENDRWRIVATKVGGGFSPVACREKAGELSGTSPPPV
ncbi:hypothetical protein FQN57_002475 [Myotisia sp. PD_48]|nr:hypothetical protein FQN57_002475 [Myotisia sp. PD_48]